MRAFLLAALLCAAPPLSRAAMYGARQAGTSAAQFLILGADARAAGMGGAASASADDATAIYWNPADLAGLHYRHATLTHSASYQSTFRDFVAYAQPIESRRGGRTRGPEPDQLGVIGAALQYQNAGRIDELDNAGAATGSSFAPQDFAATVGWGTELVRDRLDAGLSVKYVSSSIEAGATTGAADFGARFRAQLPDTEIDYALSAALRNVGGPLKFRDASDPLPMSAVIGQALRPLRSLTIAVDVNAPRDAAPYVSFGVEWRAPMTEGLTASLRAGRDGRLQSTGAGGSSGITCGGGLGFQRLAFDYAWTPSGDLGDTQLLTLSYRF